MLMIKLGKAGCPFPASGAWRGNHNERARGLNVFVFAIALIAYDMFHVGRVTCNGIMAVYRYAKRSKPALESIRSALPAILREHNAAYIKADGAEGVDQAQHILVIGNAKISAHLVLFNVRCVDNDHDLSLILKLKEHLYLAVRCKAWQNARCMVIVKQLSTEFKV